MTDCNIESSVVDWTIDYPVTMSLFDRLGIDCSCGGKSLEYACSVRGLDPQWVLRKLERLFEGQDENREAAR